MGAMTSPQVRQAIGRSPNRLPECGRAPPGGPFPADRDAARRPGTTLELTRPLPVPAGVRRTRRTQSNAAGTQSVSQSMPNAALAQVLDRWAGSPAGDPDSNLLARFLTGRDE